MKNKSKITLDFLSNFEVKKMGYIDDGFLLDLPIWHLKLEDIDFYLSELDIETRDILTERNLVNITVKRKDRLTSSFYLSIGMLSDIEFVKNEIKEAYNS